MAVWQVGDPVLARNYDYAPERLEGSILHTRWVRPVIGSGDCAWGLLDGLNDAGLAVSLAFGLAFGLGGQEDKPNGGSRRYSAVPGGEGAGAHRECFGGAFCVGQRIASAHFRQRVRVRRAAETAIARGATRREMKQPDLAAIRGAAARARRHDVDGQNEQEGRRPSHSTGIPRRL